MGTADVCAEVLEVDMRGGVPYLFGSGKSVVQPDRSCGRQGKTALQGSSLAALSHEYRMARKIVETIQFNVTIVC
jgi:hypothetical protein